MTWNVEASDEFTAWYNGLDDDETDSVDAAIELLEKYGPILGRPYADVVHQSGFPNMKELRVQHQGRPYRILFVFDPRRCAYLILGGDKTGNDRWYDEWVPIADRIYKQHLAETRS
ncbi:MAG: type II toxin-antitoxin system RelE/ParE family toxin [Candidatus Korobacteraceae bacterium]